LESKRPRLDNSSASRAGVATTTMASVIENVSAPLPVVARQRAKEADSVEGAP
jgi:hypothetical protein